MTQWGLEGIGSSHLNPNAVVAFVDGELSDGASTRAQRHLAGCPVCAAETRQQRQVRGMVRRAEPPRASAGLLSVLREIPDRAELPDSFDGLAVSSDGELVGAGRAGPGAASGPHAAIASLGEHHWSTRRAVQGAGAVVSGLVLGAVAFVAPNVIAGAGRAPSPGSAPRNVVPASGRNPAPKTHATARDPREAPAGEAPAVRRAHPGPHRDARSPRTLVPGKPSTAVPPTGTLRELIPTPRTPVTGSPHDRPQP
jgi:anti-sigma factor RsiW